MRKLRGEHAPFLIVAVVLAAAWSAVAWQITADYQETRHAGLERMIADTATVEMRIRLLLDGGIATAVAAARDIRALGDLGTLDVATITATLKRKLAGGRAIHALWLATRKRFACVGHDGQRVSNTIPDWQTQSFAVDAPHFWIGRPTAAPFDHSERVIPVARHLPPAGHQSLWAGALLHVRVLKSMLVKSLARGESAALISSDGTLLIGLHAAPQPNRGMGLPHGATLRKIIDAGHDGLIETTDGADDARRISAYRKFDYYPLIAVATIDTDTLLAAWRRRTLQTLALAVAGTLIFLLLARHLSRAISRRKRAERALLALNTDLDQRVSERTAQLAAANTELEAFSYSVSHDLRAPLRHILGFSRLAQDMLTADSTAAAQRYLGRVHHAAHKMDGLIHDLLQLAKVRHVRLRLQQLDISQMAGRIGRTLAESQPERQVDFTVRPGMTARGDAGLIQIALENLLGNAWKFTRNTEHARVEMTQHGTWFIVRDNGVGFDMKPGADPFAPFQRYHSESEFEGSGIGLATVKRIITRHGGDVRATAAVGQGANFSFTLTPFARSDRASANSEAVDWKTSTELHASTATPEHTTAGSAQRNPTNADAAFRSNS